MPQFINVTDVNGNNCFIFVNTITCISLNTDKKVVISLLCGSKITVRDTYETIMENLKLR